MFNLWTKLFKRTEKSNGISKRIINSDDFSEKQVFKKDDEKIEKTDFEKKYGGIDQMPYTMTFEILKWSAVGLLVFCLLGVFLIPIISMKTNANLNIMFEIFGSIIFLYIGLLIVITRRFFVKKDKTK